MRANLPKNETARLAALRDYHILDTLPEQAFEDLTLLASHICGTPITLISLVDQDRQWFKSERGLGISQTSRDLSFCAHALLQPDDLLIVPDARQDERFADNALVTGEPYIQFYAGAPLLTPAGEALGTLCVIDRQPRELSEAQQQALRALARQTMAQMELRRYVLELADHMVVRLQTEAALRESEERFRAFMDNSPMVAFLKDAQGRYTYVNRPFLQRFGFQTEQVVGHADVELWPANVPQVHEHDLSVLASEELVSTIETVPMPDGQEHFWQVYKFPLQQEGQGRLLAGIALDITESKRYEQQLEEYHQKLEAAFAQVETQSLTDGLTGLSNRRAFNRKLDEEFERARRYALPLSLLMMDVDKFKSFNDTFGHPSGDELLQTLARSLEAKARTADLVARYGGEEFAVILPNTGAQGAFILAERFRRAVQAMPWPKRPVTVSIGVSSLTPAFQDGAALLAAADKALYQAKQGGRNRVAQAKE